MNWEERKIESKLQVFKNDEFGEIRTVEDQCGKPLFCGSDVAKALGYKRTADAITAHCKGVCVLPTPSEGGIQNMKYITEGDVYRLITHSKLPSAEKFERWVFDEVLPTIRKTGGYVANDDVFLQTYLPFADEQTKLMFKAQLMVITNLNHKIEEQKPLVEFANHVSDTSDLIDMGRFAKILHDKHINIGRNKLFVSGNIKYTLFSQ